MLGVLTAGELYEKSAELSHHDPFDRILVSQAKAENMVFLTHDSLIPYYGERCIMSV